MNKHDYIFLAGLIVLSLLTSFMLTFYGISIVMSGNATSKALTFAYVTIAYGLGNLAVLSLAWSSREAWAVMVSKLFALIYFGVFVIDRVRYGLQDLQGLASILILAVILAANWYAVKTVVNRS